MGGVWECQIRSAHSILVALLKTHGTSLNVESLRTFLAKAEAIINTRPITSESLSDVYSPVPLCPMHLPTMKSRVVVPPPREFQRKDIYCMKEWRHVQHLANEFWSRWKKKFMQPCKFVINRTKLSETLRLETLFCYGRRLVGTSGQWIE